VELAESSLPALKHRQTKVNNSRHCSTPELAQPQSNRGRRFIDAGRELVSLAVHAKAIRAARPNIGRLVRARARSEQDRGLQITEPAWEVRVLERSRERSLGLSI
jgi:hypothetical protein